MTLKEWLESRPISGSDTRVVERLAELICVNGGAMSVSGWGCTSFCGGPYGRSGLEQEEALQLLHLSGVVQGFILAGASEEEFRRDVQLEIERVEALYEASIGTCGA